MDLGKLADEIHAIEDDVNDARRQRFRAWPKKQTSYCKRL